MTPQPAALLQASGLPERWRGRERFVVLAAGAGAVRVFIAVWQAWRADPDRCARLHFIAVGPELSARAPLAAPALDSAQTDAARQLAEAWPPWTKNLHRLAFDDGAVQLLLAPGEPATWLREIVARVDTFFLSGGAVEDPLGGQPRLAKALARLAAPAATFVADAPDSAANEALRAAGFQFEPASRAHSEEPIVARYLPRFQPRGVDTRRPRDEPSEHRALIVGAGLAGCAAAWALAEQGWRSTVFERNPVIAGAASGNPAGLFHGIVNGQDGTHARFNRAAALAAHSAVATAIASHRVAGAVSGLLQLVDAPQTARAMAALLERLDLPAGYVRAVDVDEASAIAGLRLARPAWFYPGGGWVDPAGLARSFLERTGSATELRCAAEVVALRRTGSVWQLLDAAGRVIDTAATVVLANAAEALRLIGGTWPVEQVRGQISMLEAAPAAALQSPTVPISGAGYLLPAVDGRLVFGATSQPGDTDPAVRHGDHVLNLAQLARLAPALGTAAGIDPAHLSGRTAWRCTSRDRLPLIGAVPFLDIGGRSPDLDPAPGRRDQPRFVPRRPGLFVYTALGSRGIGWSALGARVLASTITGAPSPVETGLLDAVDPARFIVRASRRPDGSAR